jgi:hypothetical protein
MGICSTTLPAMNTASRERAMRSPNPACRPNNGRSVKSAASTKPATQAASMISGARRTMPLSRMSGLSARAAFGALPRSTSGARVRTKPAAPARKGVHPRVPVNSSIAGPATTPSENTVP